MTKGRTTFFIGPDRFDDLSVTLLRQEIRRDRGGAWSQIVDALGRTAAVHESGMATLALLADSVPSGTEEAPVLRLIERLRQPDVGGLAPGEDLPPGIVLTDWDPKEDVGRLRQLGNVVRPQEQGYAKCADIGFVALDGASGQITVGTLTNQGELRRLSLQDAWF